MTLMTRERSIPRVYLAVLAGATLVAAVGAAFAAMLAGSSAAAPTVAPTNTAEPVISGTARVGQVLRTTRGTWSGTEPFDFTFRWFRCEGAGAPDASDCRRITNATNATYVLRLADAGFRIRSQVTATNDDGSATATSNPTAVVQTARPTNTTEPSISGSAVVGSRLTANRGEWVGDTPMTFAFQWLRCNASGDDCGEIAAATDNTYLIVSLDLNRTIRVRVTARNDAGSRSALSKATAQVRASAPEPPTGASLSVESLQAGGDRLVVSQVQFTPNPVTSRTAPITVRVRITARQGRAVRGALVFMRATPRVVQGQTRATEADGWVTLTLVPNRQFPQPRSGFNVQFFVKAYRSGDPALGGIAGYRLVQVRLAG